MPIKKKKIKVLVAMSGGVDSSVAAALLQDGYDVTGAFMKQWSEKMQNVCTWKQDRREALRVAAHLGIPLLTLDFEKEYREWVLSYMLREYENGRTPNPDVLCNKYIKFGFWLDEARRRGFEYLATGHYARLGREIPNFKSQIPNKSKKQNSKITIEQLNNLRHELRSNDGTIQLLEAKDKNKDQTYFLHQLGQNQLQHTLFPVGDLLKSEVRSLARKANLPTAERAESMGICFVGEVPMKQFLQNKIKTKPGKIVTNGGAIVGDHDGLAFYTIGQRHGVLRHPDTDHSREKDPLANARRTGGSSVARLPQNDGRQAMFVVDKRMDTNELVVGYEDDPLVHKKEIEIADMHWISGHIPKFPLQCSVRLRHRQPMQNAECRMQNDRLIAKFGKAQKAVTPGQFAVLYKDGECLGGGIIS